MTSACVRFKWRQEFGVSAKTLVQKECCGAPSLAGNAWEVLAQIKCFQAFVKAHENGQLWCDFAREQELSIKSSIPIETALEVNFPRQRQMCINWWGSGRDWSKMLIGQKEALKNKNPQHPQPEVSHVAHFSLRRQKFCTCAGVAPRKLLRPQPRPTQSWNPSPVLICLLGQNHSFSPTTNPVCDSACLGAAHWILVSAALADAWALRGQQQAASRLLLGWLHPATVDTICQH